MKRLIGILISVSMVFSAGSTALAAPNVVEGGNEEEETVSEADTVEAGDVVSADEEDAVSEEEGQELSEDSVATVEYHEGLSLTLSYDDRYDLSELEGISADTEYVLYETEDAQGQGITSYQVSQGTETNRMDEALLTLKEGSNAEVIATGVGSGTVWVVPADQAENPEETIDVYEIEVTVHPATLTLMFLAGQSNMEGYCDSYTGYTPDTSIACAEGTVYSTYAPWGADKGKEITGIDFSEVCTTGNYTTTAGDFVAGSLQGTVTEEGLDDPLNISGGTLEYSLNSLTSAGNGKTGPDSGLAYEWNQRTEDKVWVVNTAYGATNISQWIPGGSCYDRSAAIWEKVLQTYNAELSAGHYIEGSRLVFWQQGETGDATNVTPVEYESYFDTMYNAMTEALGMDAFGFFMVRAGYATNRGAEYRSDKDLQMTPPRIAQYWLGSGNSSYDNVYVATNANELWVSDSGVKTYFQDRYGSELPYPTQNGSESVPTTVNAVHYDIHYSQIGHNENGITAADGMVEALTGSSAPGSVSWRGADGETISSLTLELSTDTGIAVPVADPVYTTKQVSCSFESGSVISYDAPSGLVAAISDASVGTEDLVASAGSETGTLPVTISTPVDMSEIAGSNYTGLYLYNGIRWYLKNGIIQMDYEGVEKSDDVWWYVKDGRVDLTYIGFAENKNGWWYIEEGRVTFSKNGVIKDTNAKVDGAQTWWYVEGSKVQFDYNGFAENSNGKWYIENGKVTFTKHGVLKDAAGAIGKAGTWYYVDGSKVHFDYTGFAENSNGKWYIENGIVTFSQYTVLKDTDGAIGSKGTWYYVVKGKVQTDFTGLADYKNANGWWYIKDGVVDFTANTVAKNKNGWYYVEGGKVIFSYNGFGENKNGKWYIENGKVRFDKNSVIKDTTGAVGKTGTWYYVVGSKVQADFTGLADYKNGNGWWYIKDGVVDFTANTVAKNKNGWYYIEGGKVIFSYNGFGENKNGKWYIENGKVRFDQYSVIKDTAGAVGKKGTWYYVVRSKVQADFTGLADYKNSHGWWYIRDGVVDFTHYGIEKNKNGRWYVADGKVDFSYNGNVTVSGITYSVTNGKASQQG